MSTRYILHPGEVTSRRDGQVHHIGVGQLRELYGLRPSDRYVETGPFLREQNGDVHLYPRFDGEYRRVHEREDDPA